MQEQDDMTTGMAEIERVRRQVEEVRERIRAVTAREPHVIDSDLVDRSTAA